MLSLKRAAQLAWEVHFFAALIQRKNDHVSKPPTCRFETTTPSSKCYLSLRLSYIAVGLERGAEENQVGRIERSQVQ